MSGDPAAQGSVQICVGDMYARATTRSTLSNVLDESMPVVLVSGIRWVWPPNAGALLREGDLMIRPGVYQIPPKWQGSTLISFYLFRAPAPQYFAGRWAPVVEMRWLATDFIDIFELVSTVAV